MKDIDKGIAIGMLMGKKGKLIAKTVNITENGTYTYDPADDNADGYSGVTVGVNVQGMGSIGEWFNSLPVFGGYGLGNLTYTSGDITYDFSPLEAYSFALRQGRAPFTKDKYYNSYYTASVPDSPTPPYQYTAIRDYVYKSTYYKDNHFLYVGIYKGNNLLYVRPVYAGGEVQDSYNTTLYSDTGYGGSGDMITLKDSKTEYVGFGQQGYPVVSSLNSTNINIYVPFSFTVVETRWSYDYHSWGDIEETGSTTRTYSYNRQANFTAGFSGGSGYYERIMSDMADDVLAREMLELSRLVRSIYIQSELPVETYSAFPSFSDN